MARRKHIIWTCALSVCGIAACVVTTARGQELIRTMAAPSAGVAVSSPSANNVPAPRWAESLGVPSIYVRRARIEVAAGHNKLAASSLRRAAAILTQRSEHVYGLDRRQLSRDAAALRLTARDVAAGAVTNPWELNSVLRDTHHDLGER